MKRKVAVLLALVMAAVAVGGCSSQQKPAENGGLAVPSSESAQVETVSGTKDETAEPVYGGVLVYSPTEQAEQNLGYPAGDTNMLMTANASPALESLFRQDAEGNIECWLVESYDISEDAKTYTFHIRQNVEFHDGTPLNAEAVAWNIQQCIDNGKSQFLRISKVNVLDDNTLEVSFSEADILFLSNLASDPSGLIISPTAFNKNGAQWAEKHPVGTGPFTFVEWQNDVKVVYARNENYWGKDDKGNQLPYLDGVQCVYMTETAVAEAALEAGELHAWIRTNTDSLTKFSQKEGFLAQKAAEPSANLHLMACTDTDNPAAVKEFREAVAYAIDFDAIVNGLFGANSVRTNQCSVEGRIFYNDQITTREYNPDKARELLEAAGYKDGAEISVYASQTTFLNQLCTAMGPYLEAVGITPNFVFLDTGGFFELMMNGFDEGFLIGGYAYSPNEFGKMYNLMSASASMPVKNYSMDEETYDLFEQARGSLTMEECVEKVHQIQENVYGKNLYCISMMTQYEGIIRNDKVNSTGFFEYAGYHWTPETAFLTE